MEIFEMRTEQERMSMKRRRVSTWEQWWNIKKDSISVESGLKSQAHKYYYIFLILFDSRLQHSDEIFASPLDPFITPRSSRRKVGKKES